MRANPIITNFTAGEISPRLRGRVDVSKYYNGCQQLENFIVMPHGGICRRPGIYYVSAAKKQDYATRLVPFEFSTTQAYIIEFGDEYLRFYKDRGIISLTYSAWVTSTAYSLGALVTNSGSYYRCLIAHTSATFSSDLSAGRWELTGGATDLAYEIPTMYTEDELFELQFAQSADTLYIAHPSHPPAALTRTAHTSWTLSTIAFAAATKAKITGATKANPCVVTAEDHGFVNGNVVYISDVAGMTNLNGNYYTVAGKTDDTFQLSGIDSSSYGTYTSGGYAQRAMTNATKANPCVITCVKHGFEDGDMVYISGVSGMTQLNGSYYIVASSTNDTFALEGIDSSAYSTYTSGGVPARAVFGLADHYPSCVAFYEQRLCWGASNDRPQTIWMSVSADYTNHEKGAEDDSALEYTIASDKVNRIRWMVPGNYLFLGTAGGEFKIGGSSSTDVLTPSNVNAKRQSTYGSKNVQGLLIGNSVIFLQRSGKKVRELTYDFDTDSYRSVDVTLLAEHITKTADPTALGITCMSHQQDPDSILWSVREDGVLLGMTYERDQQVIGWHRHTTESGYFESVAVIPGVGEDEVWVSVETSTGHRYVGYMTPRDFGDQRDAFFVDAGLTADGGAEAVVTLVEKNVNPQVNCVNSFTNGDKVRFQNVQGMTELNGNVYTVTGRTATYFQLSGTDTSSYGTWVDPEEGDPTPTVEKVSNSFAGATHLAGLTCRAYGDGGDIGEVAVDGSGNFTTTSYYNTLHLGLPFTSVCLPMQIEAGSTLGTAQGEVKRIHGLAAKIYESLPFQQGPSLDDLRDIPFELNSELYSGDLFIEFDGDYGLDADIYLVQSLCNPLTILSVMPKMETVE